MATIVAGVLAFTVADRQTSIAEGAVLQNEISRMYKANRGIGMACGLLERFNRFVETVDLEKYKGSYPVLDALKESKIDFAKDPQSDVYIMSYIDEQLYGEMVEQSQETIDFNSDTIDHHVVGATENTWDESHMQRLRNLRQKNEKACLSASSMRKSYLDRAKRYEEKLRNFIESEAGG